MTRIATLIYGLIAYTAFLGTFLYAIGFLFDIGVPKGVNDGTPGPVWLALLIDVSLLGLFGLQHSIMARPWFKARWTRIVPKAMERSTFVLATCLVMALMFWFWRPINFTLWSAGDPVTEFTLLALSAVGWLIVLYSSFLIDHFDLFGVRQVVLNLKNQPYTYRPFVVRSLYRVVRHPLMLGFLIAFWATPEMTGARLLFAGITTAYILVALQFEERDLVRFLGDDYRAYRRRTPMLIPGLRRPTVTPPVAAATTEA